MKSAIYVLIRCFYRPTHQGCANRGCARIEHQRCTGQGCDNIGDIWVSEMDVPETLTRDAQVKDMPEQNIRDIPWSRMC